MVLRRRANSCTRVTSSSNQGLFVNSTYIKFRSIGRKIGLHHLNWRIRNALRLDDAYEERCRRVLEKAIRKGDVVWDIGANTGVYTHLFLTWAGAEGQVVAFEPNPAAIEELRKRVQDSQTLVIENIALGSQEENSDLIVGLNDTVGHVRTQDESLGSEKFRIPIHVSTGDTVCARLGRTPNVIKIDVEGFEEEVLIGLQETLASPHVRVLLIEIHFQQLESRGQPTAPLRIEKSLKERKFDVNWVDRSHLLANRRA
jgi:FkbM family methyltransferase